MKISKKARDHLPNNPTSPVNHYFPYCCPENGMQVVQPSFLPKKAHKFIKLTLLKQTSQSHLITVPQTNDKTHKIQDSNNEVEQFQSDKSDFLSIIRKFNPNPENDKEETANGKTLESSKEISSSLRSGENNLSNILQSISNDMFSEMFVSSTIKGKILLSGSLGSISEVKSDMEISCPTESLVYGLHYTQDN